MRIIKEEIPSGSLQSLTFQKEGETIDELKQAIKDWLRENHPEMGWEDFFNRLTYLDINRVVLTMAHEE